MACAREKVSRHLAGRKRVCVRAVFCKACKGIAAVFVFKHFVFKKVRNSVRNLYKILIALKLEAVVGCAVFCRKQRIACAEFFRNDVNIKPALMLCIIISFAYRLVFAHYYLAHLLSSCPQRK